MRTLRRSLAGPLVLALLTGAAGVAVGQEPAEPDSFLFVGNDLTSSNDGVHEEFERLLTSEDEPGDTWVFRVLQANVTLEALLSMAEYRLSKDDYDMVILQEDLPEYPLKGMELEDFLETAREFDEIIREAGAETVFFMAWPYRSAVSLDDIVALHREAEAELGATIAPVGLAFARAEEEVPWMQVLAMGSNGHPGLLGTYLSAATIYATVFDRSPEGLYYPEAYLDEETAATLQRIAREAVQEWRAGAPVG